MTQPRCVLITGATGNLGRKLREHLSGQYELRLLDRDARGDASVTTADLATWGEWVSLFEGVDTVFHFAADPEAYRSWPELIGPNVDALIHTYHAAVRGGVKRFIFASSNHVMGGYQDDPEIRLRAETPPQPGLRYQVNGILRNSFAYGSAKLFGERLGKCYAESHGLETIAVRIGWNLRGAPNETSQLPQERGEWFRLMWLSDRDYVHLMERCLLAELPEKFLIVNGMSANTGMPWEAEPAHSVLGFEPQDDVSRTTTAWAPSGS